MPRPASRGDRVGVDRAGPDAGRGKGDAGLRRRARRHRGAPQLRPGSPRSTARRDLRRHDNALSNASTFARREARPRGPARTLPPARRDGPRGSRCAARTRAAAPSRGRSRATGRRPPRPCGPASRGGRVSRWLWDLPTPQVTLRRWRDPDSNRDGGCPGVRSVRLARCSPVRGRVRTHRTDAVRVPPRYHRALADGHPRTSTSTSAAGSGYDLADGKAWRRQTPASGGAAGR